MKLYQYGTKMTGNELKTQRVDVLKLSIADMARRLQTPYRTYQNWELRAGDVPGIVSAAVTMLVERDRQFMEDLKKRVSAA